MEPLKYMQLHRAYLLLIGIWNLERKSVFYGVYRTVMVGYFFMFASRQIVKLISILGTNNNEMMQNVGLLMMCLMAILKLCVCMSRRAAKMIETIKKREQSVLASQNTGIIKIYKYFVKYNRCLLLSYYFIVAVAAMSAFCPPILEEYFVSNLNEKKLPLSVWLPFDVQKHYYAVYLMQCIDGTIGSHFMVGTDALLISFIIFGICQLKILNHSMSNLESLEDLIRIHRDHLFVIR